MNLPKHLRARLADEYGAAVKDMRANPDPAKKLYFFSVFFGEAERVLNQAWDDELALVFLVAQTANAAIFARWDAMRRGDRNVELTDDFFSSLEAACEAVAEYVRNTESPGSDLQDALGTIGRLVYFTTGNGYYLYLRGKYKL